MKRKTRSRRNSQGKFRRSYREALAPLFWLCLGVILLAILQWYFTPQELKSPCEPECKFFMVRAVEPVEEVKTTRQEIVEYIFKVFGDDAVEAIVIIRKCENSQFNPKATNWNRNGTWDTGIFQINQIHGYSLEQMQDWKQNIDAAKKIFDRAGDWSPWSCSHVVGVTPFYLK